MFPKADNFFFQEIEFKNVTLFSLRISSRIHLNIYHKKNNNISVMKVYNVQRKFME